MMLRKNSIFYLKPAWLLILVFIISAACRNKTIYDQNGKSSDKIGIVIAEKSILRVDPIILSSVICYIDKGEKLIILDRSKEKEKLNNTENYWYNVLYAKSYKGWIFGGNIKIFSSDKTGEIDKLLSSLANEELSKLRDRISGKWEIMDGKLIPGNTLELFSDGKYTSFHSNKDIIEGEYTVNPGDNEIIFQNGSHFGKRIYYNSGRNGYSLSKTKGGELKFKKISLKNNEDNNAVHDITGSEKPESSQRKKSGS